MSFLRSKISKINLSVIESGIIYFVIYGFIGWLIDSMYRSFEAGQIIFGGMFLSFYWPIPFAPIYGFGALILIAFKKVLWNKNPFLVVPAVGIILTAVEYLGGEFTLAVLQHRAWDYSKNFLNFRGHIDLLNGLCWMALGWAFVKFIHPAVEILAKRILTRLHGN
ncbi:MAG: putative ABC transporter permease [Patescibacteria group bacterium]